MHEFQILEDGEEKTSWKMDRIGEMGACRPRRVQEVGFGPTDPFHPAARRYENGPLVAHMTYTTK